MEDSQKELIEKLNTIHKLLVVKQYKNAKISLAALIFSINSGENEIPTVTDNEAKGKVCQYCHGTKVIELLDCFGGVATIKRCPYC